MASSLVPAKTPLVILSEGCFGEQESKTATGVIRYGEWPITAVIDSRQAGKTVEAVTGIPSQSPIVRSLQEALARNPKPKALLIGTAPKGGGLTDEYKAVVVDAIKAGLHIVNGLHIFLNNLPEIKSLAEKHKIILWDVRNGSDENIITRMLPRPANTKVITMVGSDCSIGKMFSALELNKALLNAGERSEFVATGQTGIMISGNGIPLDRVIGDFMAGQLEAEIDRVIQAKKPNYVIVEGQGSLLHPAYSSVTLGLVHGSAPDAMVLCHNPKLKAIRNFESVKIPSYSELIKIYETAAGWIKPAKVIGISLNTSAFSDEEAKAFIQQAESETGLPATDPVRFGFDALVQKLVPNYSKAV